ncbi:MAG: hypothetical protein ACXV2G_01840 [Actinomycetes bacterium]
MSAVLAASLFPAVSADAATAPISSRYFGVSDGAPAGTSAAGFPRAPVGSIRLWDSGTAWNQLEYAPGKWNFDHLDRVVATARAKNAKPLLVLGQTPRFHATHPGWAGAYGKGAPSMPHMNAWKRYVATVAQRYGTRVDYQVWNEPNVRGYWRGSPGQMAQLTAAARHILKTWAPGATLAAPSFPVRLSTQRAWLARYYAQKTGGHRVSYYVDVASLNLYPLATGTPESSMQLLRSARSILSRYNVHKPIWNTEINYGLTGKGTNAKNISRRREAAYVSRTYVLNAAKGVRRVFWYSWDLHGLANTEMTYSNSATLAPGGRAFTVTSSWLVGGRMRGCSVSSNNTYTCTVSYAGGVKRIYWNPSRSASVRAVGSATYYQGTLGTKKTLHGGERLAVGYAPIMVRSTR